MNPALGSKFRFTKPLYGGPVFDFPHYNLKGVDLSNLTENMATRLIQKGYTGIEAIKDAPAKNAGPLDSIATAKP